MWFPLFFLQIIGCFLFVAAFTVPAVNYPIRITLHHLFRNKLETPMEQSHHSQATTRLRQAAASAASVTPVLLAFLVSMFVTDVGLVFSFVGAISSTSAAFLFPCALFIASPATSKTRAHVVAAAMTIVFGVALLVLGVVSATRHAAKSSR
jgi:amino acid permease